MVNYDRDYVAWSDEQAMLLEQKRWSELDLVHLIEEVKDLGNRHRDALESQLARLLMHLLKWKYQPENQGVSWSSTIREARKQIDRLIKKHPVLRIHLERVFLECYLEAREDAADETSLDQSLFPVDCPFSLNETLTKDWLPMDNS